jgi:hypothetical protein
VATISDVCTILKSTLIAALNATGITNPANQVGIGWPFGTSASEILGQNQAQITIYPLSSAAQNRTSRKPSLQVTANNPQPLIASITTINDAFNIIFSGSVIAGLNIHTLIEPGLGGFVQRPAGLDTLDAYYQTTAEDDLFAVAANVGAALSAIAEGWSVNWVGKVVTVTPNPGSPPIRELQVNIGTTSTMAQEARRTMVPVQISVWAANSDDRNSMSGQIENALGLATEPFLYTPDGSAVWVRLRGGPSWVELSQSSYSLYEAHLIFECEYPTLQTFVGTQVEAISVEADGS